MLITILQDTEEVAKGLSENGIKSGVYHADVGDADKEALHRRWREGRVKVVCATIGELPSVLSLLILYTPSYS